MVVNKFTNNTMYEVIENNAKKAGCGQALILRVPNVEYRLLKSNHFILRFAIQTQENILRYT